MSSNNKESAYKSMEDAIKNLVNSPTSKKRKINRLIPVKPSNSPTPIQVEMELHIQKQIEIDGIGMGVLNDGTAFLTRNGLSRLCGVDGSRITEISTNWSRENPPPSTLNIKKILKEKNVDLLNPYIEVKQKGPMFHAYTDVICLAVLEYFAFDAPSPTEVAKKNFRLLAGKALHDFIYTQVGYDPNNNVPVAWQQFHDRISLTYNSVPKGYFSIFKEISDMIVTLGQAGLHIDSSFVPDGSVGGIWGRYWKDKKLAEKYGERKKWEHNFPIYFPQARSNPQEAACYPEEALGEFRRWLRECYIEGGKFANYLNTKIKQNELPPSFAEIVTKTYQLGDNS